MDIQSFITPEDKAQWKQAGCMCHDSIWRGPDGKPCLTKKLFPFYAKLTHGKDHVSKGGMGTEIQKHWFTKGFLIFSQKSHPLPQRPFEHLQMDFIELTPAEGKNYCLVIVDMFSKWVEAFPTTEQDASVVAKALLTRSFPDGESRRGLAVTTEPHL